MSMRWFAVLAFLTVCAALPARAEMVAMTATLSAANEVPPVQSPGTGSAEVTVNTVTREVSWTIMVQGLTAPMSAAHFHGPSTTGTNASIVVPIAKAGDPSPLKGSATLTPEQMPELLAGRWYINVHTPNNPPGEIRGQVVRK